MADYNFREIENKWQQHWRDNNIYQVSADPTRPKYYVLDMFPYPSGAGLHVGHPLGYIASDIVSRYKRLKGFNVLHPMGFDSFGLPAEQYAIQTGQHPAITTAQNIERYKEQLGNLGFSFDWSREVQTSSPDFYRWTQWIFMQLFQSWFNQKTNQAEPIESLITQFEQNGNTSVNAACDEDTLAFTAEEWSNSSEAEQQKMLLNYRLTYLADTVVNWCPGLGTVLANDEVKDGYSERGGYPVERKKMKQWMMRITAYADRLLDGLETIEWTDSLKEMQRNWIGRSTGCELDFKVQSAGITLTAFTTRPDTIFGVTYITLAPEHELIGELTTPEQQEEVAIYVEKAVNRSERDRMADVKTVSGAFTGSYAINPISNEPVPIWIADYVLAGYGTGVVMGVPSSDDRDFRFAKHFDLPIIHVIEGTENLENPTEKKHGTIINSDFLNGMDSHDAIQAAIDKAVQLKLGEAKVNYRMRDAVFSRQRYWGEPVPVYFKDDIPHLLDEEDLPLELPAVDEYKPTEDGEPPLGRASDWQYKNQYGYELTTMPGWAGSSWYHFRYMDAHNEEEFVSKEAQAYWGNVDLYIGGTEHATGHLLYSRFWTKFLHDRGYVTVDEPYQKLINQGMIQGQSSIVYRVKGKNEFVSLGLKDQYEVMPMHIDVSLVSNNVLDTQAFQQWRDDLNGAQFILEEGKYLCGSEVEKMSKRLFNVVNPDDVVEQYGADTLRLYEMFLGPLEQSKPWNTNGIDGVFKFLRKLWRLFHDGSGNFSVSEAEPTSEELKVLHRAIKKTQEDIENYSFNTTVSSFMICVNELTSLKCNKRSVLTDLVVILSPFAPHIAEELWHLLGNVDSVTQTNFPNYNEEYLIENVHEYPISINGKVRTKLNFALDMSKENIEQAVLQDETVHRWLDGKSPKRVIVVPKRIVNIVI
ncbi:leucine--tRNA ligase [Tunicatimonas pelagia]|uniref:leucine--tRNA ligase n=1 Tax=Tunicatimonas pelagia TaxID=931531 RepID=UPI0026669CEF|nr:leucine--tRNA ligase [Tunicatimonas pelagia]WKN43219.1 leucine--tRNA ligase [Tunicatimonas pelagia]